jgi:hypothetical protein
MLREFRLAPPGNGQGVSCDANVAFVGVVPLLKRSQQNDRWESCDSEQLSKLIGANFSLPIDMSSKISGLKAICSALNEGDIVRAQIAAVLLAIPDRPALINGKCARDHMIKFIRDLHWSKLISWDGEDAPNSALSSQDICLTKAGYNSREPRDDLGQWTDSGGSNAASANPLLQYGAGEGTLNDGVYHPGVDPGQLDELLASRSS